MSDVEFTTKPPFTLTYRIRPEARWSDGVPVTAGDFVFTHQVSLRKDVDARWLPDAERIRSVRAIGAKTLEVVLGGRFAGWRQLFSFVLPRHVLAGEDLTAIWRDRIDNPKSGEPIGSGPFLLQSVEGRNVTFVRNPRYWGAHKAYLGRIVLRAYPGRDEAEALRRGEVDVVSFTGGQAPVQPGITVLTSHGTLLEHFAIRIGPAGHPALRNKLVRRALAYGIDREAIVREAAAPRPWLLDNAVFFTNSTFYEPHWARYRYRPAEARRLLDQAGCRRGADGIFVCTGERLSLRFFTTAGNPARQAVLEHVQAQLREAGVEALPRYVPPSALGALLGKGDFDVVLFRWILEPDPAGTVDIYGCGKESNVTGYCSRLVTRDLDGSNLIFDAERRATLLNRVDIQLARDVPVLPLYQAPASLAFTSRLRGMTADFVWKSENWWLER